MRIADLDEARQGAVQRGLDLLAQRSAARCAAAIGLLNADDLKTLGQMWSLQNMSILESLGLPIAGGL